MSHPQSQIAFELPDVLGRAIERVSALELPLGTHRERLVQMRDRLREERFHLAVLGQFKRGKSTLLNALLGDAVLPAAVLPVTAIPTFLRAGEERRVRIEFEDHRRELTEEDDAISSLLSRFATEEGNPQNRLGVSGVEVFHPAPILRAGVVLIDTPGIGSTLLHNTVSTLEFLPQCDAALFLTSVDPPITQVELEFLREVRSKVARLFFVLNKIDYLAEEERRNAIRYFERALREELADDEELTVFAVSAREGLQAKLSNDPALWKRSGIGDVDSHLIDFLTHEKKRTLERAVAKKTEDVLEGVLLEARLAIRSLEIPGEELEERLRLLAGKIEEARRQQVQAADLLAGEEKRLERLLEETAGQWRRMASEHLGCILRAVLEGSGEGPDPYERALEKAIEEAIPSFFERELGCGTRAFEQRFAEAIGAHQVRLHELVESVRRAAADLFDVPYESGSDGSTFEVSRQPYWITHKWSTSLSPLPEGLFDRLLPQGVRGRRMKARFVERIETLVRQNVENLRWALLQALGDGFRRFRRSLDEGLEEAIAATRGAIEAASARGEERPGALSQEIARLRVPLEELEAIQNSVRMFVGR